jgi:peroxiredoxin
MMADKSELQVGQPAPDATVQNGAGNDIQLSSLWQGDQPLLLVFIRHFG